MRRLAFVTGGAGFIGSHLVDRLVADEWRVRVVDNLSGGRLENKPAMNSREAVAETVRTLIKELSTR